MLPIEIKPSIFFTPNKIWSAKDTNMIYPPNISPVNVYSPIALSFTFTNCTYLSLSLLTAGIFSKIKAIKATNIGTNTNAIVKL